ncbi:MORN motif protein (macronuclear) [Tetrahymena thermophila SB210]|uniref:MORN motif protein n=1 Tax=Tetrahymena thermophila (strain SB210) TaxID=312017 RepID=I7LWC6_TETTS|nr:MORN motif protein [Tetrahymena thermophila SB210]EAS01380.1 MORN motif protein [Tetrahymena thermophila SB210]|eukprot:XP_001021626.1 MORN motif protein [Tetrahymena thermophila SB210]
MSQQSQVSNKNNFRRRTINSQQLEFQSPEKESNANDQPKLSQDSICEQQEQQISVNLSIDNSLQSNSQKDDQGIITPKKDKILVQSFTDALIQQNNQQNNKQLISKNFLSPTSSQSSNKSRSSLSSPIQIRINPNQYQISNNTARRSLNYEISQIQEKRLEDEKTAISYAEKVLQSRNFLSQQKSKQENQRYSLFVTTAQQAGVYVGKEGQQQGILKKKTNNNYFTNTNQLFNTQNQLTFIADKTKSVELNENNIQQDEKNNLNNSSSKINKILLPDRSEITNKINGAEINQFVASDNKKVNFQTLSQQPASSKVRSRKVGSSSLNNEVISGKEISILDKKALTKITKVNTERNSIIQPERSMDDHYNKLPRCYEHSKRIKELYCVDDNCQVKNKFGCVLCFSSVNGSPHSFHEYYTISSEEDLQAKINRNRQDFIQFIQDKIQFKCQDKKSQFYMYQDQITESLINYADSIQDRLFIGFEAEEIQKFQLPLLQGSIERKSPAKKSKRNSKENREEFDEKELSIILYIDLLEKQLNKKIENQNKIWLQQIYLGEKNEEFLKEKKCKLIIAGKCFSNLSDQILKLYLTSEQVNYDLQELENNKSQLYYINDENSDGIYQLDDDKVKQGRGIQFFKSGGLYEGYFKNNQKHGKGKLITFEGDVYIGEFQKNMKRGRGVLTYSNKDIYDGEFYQDTCHGIGKMSYAKDQVVYIGGWNKNQRHGKGQIFKDNELIFSGVYIGDNPKANSKE